MPHVIVKMYPGRSADTIEQLAQAITRDVVAIAGCAEKSVSVALEEVPPEKWAAEVYLPDIQGQADNLIKKPGYDPFS
ncbi:MAG: tautomerase family protein [Desulfobacterales bacterium]|nr:tautomerase family protein [Desulfobacterales bacterium]MDJ0883306.1 tautomerase family protein [Desulfobacterales bacterium]